MEPKVGGFAGFLRGRPAGVTMEKGSKRVRTIKFRIVPKQVLQKGNEAT
jgi:hypothetical protein